MSFIRRHVILSIILFFIPVIITVTLWILDCQVNINITISDWITLLAGLFTYYGTVILAIVTVSQNDKLIEFQERQEKREKLQGEREERQERREERQERREERHEERDKFQQKIAHRQLEISEKQKEIADRQLAYIKREQEINETILRDENQPNFEITSLIILQGGIEKRYIRGEIIT